MLVQEKDIIKDWIIDCEIYIGRLSCVHLAHHKTTKELVVIKSINNDNTEQEDRLLMKEKQVYRALEKNIKGFPELIYSGTQEYEDEYYQFLVFSYVGKDVGVLQKYSKFNSNQIREYSMQMINRLETIHNLGILHNDLKPKNFCVLDDVVYLIDFGLASFFELDGKHVPYCIGKNGFSGTITYSSISMLSGIERSRRDDLESLVYVITDFIEDLPWKRIPNAKNLSKMEKRDYVRNMKACFCPNNLAMKKLIKYVRELKFTEKPNYNEIRSILSEI
jgi:serine/threonine protein kinase